MWTPGFLLSDSPPPQFRLFYHIFQFTLWSEIYAGRKFREDKTHEIFNFREHKGHKKYFKGINFREMTIRKKRTFDMIINNLKILSLSIILLAVITGLVLLQRIYRNFVYG